ncbi:MAG: antitoxin VapB family protein [Theionarchaea archaeon]|nr:antitoxin VapB family protein [Theionarchaea archaeon]
MSYKTISLRDDVYESLVKMKRKNEFFSDVISRLMYKRSILDFAGRWADIPEEKIEELVKELETMRDSTRDRLVVGYL